MVSLTQAFVCCYSSLCSTCLVDDYPSEDESTEDVKRDDLYDDKADDKDADWVRKHYCEFFTC